MTILGWYVNPDDAVCADDAPAGFAAGDWSEWGGCPGWESPAAITSDESSDTPTHCVGCCEIIPHPLTSDGYDYVSEALGRALDGNPGMAIGKWMAQYGDQVDIPASWLDPFTAGYAYAMLWVNLSDVRDIEGTGHDAGPEDWQTPAGGWQIRAFTPASQASITADCAAFTRECWASLAGLNPGQCGHDFALTRNGHGTGFWDRGLGEAGAELTRAAHVYGSSGAWFDSADRGPVVWLDDASDAPEISD